MNDSTVKKIWYSQKRFEKIKQVHNYFRFLFLEYSGNHDA